MSEMIGAVSRAMSDDGEAKLRALQVDAIRRLSLPMMSANLVNLGAFMLVLWKTGQASPVAFAWAAALAAFALIGLERAWRTRHRPRPLTTSERTLSRVIRSALVFGLLWSLPGIAFMPALTGFTAVFAYLLLTGMIAGGAFALYPIPRAALAFAVPVVASGTVGLGLAFGPIALGPAVVAAMFLLVFERAVQRHADLFTSEFTGRLELEKRNRLIEDLLEDARVGALGTRQVIEERLARAQKVEAIGNLTGGIAHNFNNLLATIQGNAELLKLEQHAESALIDPILNGCRQGAEQVQRLLSIAGKQVLQPEATDLKPLICGLVRMIRPSLGTNHRIETEFAHDLDLAMVDAPHLEGALLNLILNARDAMPDGGEITLACRNVPAAGVVGRLVRADAEKMVQIAVHDTGTGMDAATRERATNPFFTTKPPGQGLGLGLSSAEGFARQSHGALKLESAPGKGTTVTLTLPVAAQPAQGAEPEEVSDPTPATVLLVEDYADVRKVTEDMLRRLGYEVVTASGPEAAMRLVTSPEWIDVVLTDILLSSVTTGLQLAKDIRHVRPDLPVTFMSGLSHRHEEADPGAGTRILPKPFTVKQLEEHMRRALANRPPPGIPYMPGMLDRG